MRTVLRTCVLTVAMVGPLVACGDDDDAGTVTSATTTPAAVTTTSGAGHDHPAGSDSTVAAAANACPVDGCRVTITSVEKAGDELKLTFQANYTPDISKNHFHVYWDHFDAKQVSNDAETKYQVKQGDWEPTGDNPYTTAGTVSVSVRQGSPTVCVTAGDRDHNVLDPTLVDCRDVTAVLS